MDELPLLRGAQLPRQLLKRLSMFRCVVEPCEEVERFVAAEVAAVTEARGDRRQVLQSDRDVLRALLTQSPTSGPRFHPQTKQSGIQNG
jgi:hypothetical protein